MGCFNVACSISSLSISGGTPVYFIPLLKKYHKSKKYMEANFPNGFGWFENDLSSSLVYANDIFDPLCLPINGIYNEYGGLEDIVRDDSTAALELTFGIDIETLISCTHCSKDISNFTSAVYQAYRIDPEDFDIFNKKHLINIGFKYISKEKKYTHPHIKHMSMKIIPEKKRGNRDGERASYIVYDHNNNIIVERDNVYDPDSNLKKDFLRYFGYYLNIKQKDQKKADILFNLSGMYIHGDIYEYMSKGETFKSWSGDVNVAESYDEYVSQVKTYTDAHNKSKKEGSNDLSALKQLWEITNPFSSMNHGNFIGFFKDWNYFQMIYEDLIYQGKLKDQFVAYGVFYREMLHMNRFLFPSCNGLQHGNPFASKRLIEKSLEVVNREISETRKSYSEDGADYNESCIC